MLLLTATTVAVGAPKKKPAPKEVVPVEKFDQNMELLLNSGFEDSVRVNVRFKGDEKISGIDYSMPSPNDWSFKDGTRIKRIDIQYEGGDTTMRYARIVPDPTNPANKVMEFRIYEPNVGPDRGVKNKSRIQTTVVSTDLHELHQSVRVYLHPNMAELKNFSGVFSWLTLMEWWNNIGWNDTEYPFRISFGIGKPSDGQGELYFHVDSENLEYSALAANQRVNFIRKWEEMNTDIEVPFGKWFTLEYYIKEGGPFGGRFYMTYKPDGGEEVVLFDIHGDTHGEGNPEPKGFRTWHPIKLYTDTKTVNHLRRYKKFMSVYWDDLKIWGEKKATE